MQSKVLQAIAKNLIPKFPAKVPARQSILVDFRLKLYLAVPAKNPPKITDHGPFWSKYPPVKMVRVFWGFLKILEELVTRPPGLVTAAPFF